MNYTTKLFILLYFFTFIFLSSCEYENEKKVVAKPLNISSFEIIGHPLKLQYAERGGMKYMIATGSSSNAGVSIANITLDSIKVEYYKHQLK